MICGLGVMTSKPWHNYPVCFSVAQLSWWSVPVVLFEVWGL